MSRTRFLLAAALALATPAGLAQTWTATSAPGFGNLNNDELGSLEYGGFLYSAGLNTATGMEVWRYDGVGPWTPSSTGGFGDANNTELQGAAIFGGNLFVAAGNSATGLEVWSHDGATWTQVNVDGFGSAFNADGVLLVVNGTLYAITFNFVTGFGVQRYNGGSSWTPIATGGLGNANNTECDLEFWNGNLYASTYNFVTGCEVWRYVSGTTWTRVDPGSGFDASGVDNESASLYVHGNVLYAGTENYATGTEVWEYQGGTSWVQRNADGFGDARNADIEPVTAYGGALYLGTIADPSVGGEVWRFDGGSTFVQVSPAGFGAAANLAVATLEEWGGDLYATTFNAATGAEVWRYETGTTWTRVDPGAPGPGNGGFGDSGAVVGQLALYRNELYCTLPQVVYRLEPALTYCTGKTNSAGCVPFLTSVGAPSATSTASFDITANDVVPGESGFIIYSFKKANLAFHGGKLCVKAPFVRTTAKTPKNPGGGCSGWILRRNFNKTIQGGADPSLTPGRVVTAQWRQRDPADPAGFGDGLSDGIRFVILP